MDRWITTTQPALHCIALHYRREAFFYIHTYVNLEKEGGIKGPWLKGLNMCRSGLWERGLVFRRWRALLLNERVSRAGLGVLHVEGIFDGSLMGGWEEIYVGGLVVVVVVVVKTSLMVEVGLRFD